jgi:hypothetical protein
MTTRTPAQIRSWAIDHKSLAKAVCQAMAFAQAERERVDAYVLPIFQTFRFVDENGTRINSPDQLYLCNDDPMCMTFYDQCDAAHRAHGWTGPEGHCPALTAENLLLLAEAALLAAGCEFFDVVPARLHGAKRKEMLDLLLKACVSV